MTWQNRWFHFNAARFPLEDKMFENNNNKILVQENYFAKWSSVVLRFNLDTLIVYINKIYSNYFSVSPLILQRKQFIFKQFWEVKNWKNIQNAWAWAIAFKTVWGFSSMSNKVKSTKMQTRSDSNFAVVFSKTLMLLILYFIL